VARGIQAGDKAPDFTLPSQSGDQVRLQDRLGERVVVLYFYPKDNTSGCTAEACAFRDSHETFTDAGAEVIGVSSDSADRHAGFASKHRLPFTLLADQGGRVRKAYGVPAVMGLIPGRVTYVIDRTGTVRHVFNSMTNIDGHVTEALEVVRQLQAEQPALPGRLRGLVGQYLAAELREHPGDLAQQVVAVGAAMRLQVLPVPARLAAVGGRGPPRQRRDLGGEVGVEEEREGEPVPAAGVADPVRR
jgi:peroxiredoxin Q/BCP